MKLKVRVQGTSSHSETTIALLFNTSANINFYGKGTWNKESSGKLELENLDVSPSSVPSSSLARWMLFNFF